MKKPLLLLLCLFTVIAMPKTRTLRLFMLNRASHTRIWETDQTAIDRPRQWRGCV